MAEDRNELSNEAIARRLRVLRTYVSGIDHGSRARFASRVGIEYKRWNNFERGYPLPRDAATHLVQRIPGLTLDWIYLNRDDGLPLRLQRELLDAGKLVTLSEVKSGRPRKSTTNSRA